MDNPALLFLEAIKHGGRIFAESACLADGKVMNDLFCAKSDSGLIRRNKEDAVLYEATDRSCFSGMGSTLVAPFFRTITRD